MGAHPPGSGTERDLALGPSVRFFSNYDLPATHSCFLFAVNSEFSGESFKYGSVTDAKSYQGFIFLSFYFVVTFLSSSHAQNVLSNFH